MALPVTHPLNEAVITGASVDCSTGKAGVIRAPFKGVIKELGGMLGSVLATADATCTVTVAGTAVTGGNWVVTQSGSAIGDLDFAAIAGIGNSGVTANTTITAVNSCNEGDLIKFAMTGSGTAGGVYHCYAVIVRA